MIPECLDEEQLFPEEVATDILAGLADTRMKDNQEAIRLFLNHPKLSDGTPTRSSPKR